VVDKDEKKIHLYAEYTEQNSPKLKPENYKNKRRMKETFFSYNGNSRNTYNNTNRFLFVSFFWVFPFILRRNVFAVTIENNNNYHRDSKKKRETNSDIFQGTTITNIERKRQKKRKKGEAKEQ
jgi:hypothetical protein